MDRFYHGWMHAQQVLEFLTWSVLTMEAVVTLSATKYLRWRLRLYSRCCPLVASHCEVDDENDDRCDDHSLFVFFAHW